MRRELGEDVLESFDLGSAQPLPDQPLDTREMHASRFGEYSSAFLAQDDYVPTTVITTRSSLDNSVGDELVDQARGPTSAYSPTLGDLRWADTSIASFVEQKQDLVVLDLYACLLTEVISQFLADTAERHKKRAPGIRCWGRLELCHL